MQMTNINPEIYQELLDSAANAAGKGQSQFLTPLELGQLLGRPLPEHRPTLCDFQCGAGHLLQACVNESTRSLLGCDIDPCRGHKTTEKAPPIKRITADVTRLFGLFTEVDWRFDLGVFNPPWDLWWYRDRLSSLEDSEVPAVRAAFTVHDGRTTPDTVDSTVATLMMALDRFTIYGERLLIANNATLQRLIFAPGAPHGALARHVWAHLVLEGNPMTQIKDHVFSEDGSFQTGVIYFARGHSAGCRFQQTATSHEALDSLTNELPQKRRVLRTGPEVRGYSHECDESPHLWKAIAEEWRARHSTKRTDFNLWLGEDGTIRTHLSLYDQKSSRVLREEAVRLSQLAGKRPMQLVMQRDQRDDLLRAAGIGHQSVWRVCPKLQEAVQQPVKEYHACRAPLYPLPELQRLGYLDEEDFLKCKKDLAIEGQTLFRAGQAYPLTSRSVSVTRSGLRPNLEGEMETIEYSGQELALLLQGEKGRQRCFMETRLRDPKVKVDISIDFTLQELAEHFVIPEVPDIAAVDPEGFQRNLKFLEELEQFLSA